MATAAPAPAPAPAPAAGAVAVASVAAPSTLTHESFFGDHGLNMFAARPATVKHLTDAMRHLCVGVLARVGIQVREVTVIDGVSYPTVSTVPTEMAEVKKAMQDLLTNPVNTEDTDRKELYKKLHIAFGNLRRALRPSFGDQSEDAPVSLVINQDDETDLLMLAEAACLDDQSDNLFHYFIGSYDMWLQTALGNVLVELSQQKVALAAEMQRLAARAGTATFNATELAKLEKAQKECNEQLAAIANKQGALILALKLDETNQASVFSGKPKVKVWFDRISDILRGFTAGHVHFLKELVQRAPAIVDVLDSKTKDLLKDDWFKHDGWITALTTVGSVMRARSQASAANVPQNLLESLKQRLQVYDADAAANLQLDDMRSVDERVLNARLDRSDTGDTVQYWLSVKTAGHVPPTNIVNAILFAMQSDPDKLDPWVVPAVWRLVHVAQYVPVGASTGGEFDAGVVALNDLRNKIVGINVLNFKEKELDRWVPRANTDAAREAARNNMFGRLQAYLQRVAVSSDAVQTFVDTGLIYVLDLAVIYAQLRLSLGFVGDHADFDNGYDAANRDWVKGSKAGKFIPKNGTSYLALLRTLTSGTPPPQVVKICTLADDVGATLQALCAPGFLKSVYATSSVGQSTTEKILAERPLWKRLLEGAGLATSASPATVADSVVPELLRVLWTVVAEMYRDIREPGPLESSANMDDLAATVAMSLSNVAVSTVYASERSVTDFSEVGVQQTYWDVPDDARRLFMLQRGPPRATLRALASNTSLRALIEKPTLELLLQVDTQMERGNVRGAGATPTMTAVAPSVAAGGLLTTSYASMQAAFATATLARTESDLVIQQAVLKPVTFKMPADKTEMEKAREKAYPAPAETLGFTVLFNKDLHILYGILFTLLGERNMQPDDVLRPLDGRVDSDVTRIQDAIRSGKRILENYMAAGLHERENVLLHGIAAIFTDSLELAKMSPSAFLTAGVDMEPRAADAASAGLAPVAAGAASRSLPWLGPSRRYW